MAFATMLTGDDLDFMQCAWDDRESFTRTELGGVPDWADYVDECGELFSESEFEDRFAEHLDDCWEPVSACGFEFGAGRVLRELDPIAFRESFLGWIDVLRRDGDLRRIEG